MPSMDGSNQGVNEMSISELLPSDCRFHKQLLTLLIVYSLFASWHATAFESDFVCIA